MSPDKGNPRAVLALWVSVLGISTAALFIKLCGMDPLAVSFYRMAGGALVYALIARERLGSLFFLGTRHRLLALLCGALLAAHFAAWITAFEYTDVSSNLLLLVTQPVFAAALGWMFFGERPTRSTFFATALVAAGSALIFLHDRRAAVPGANPLLGNALCVAGSLALSLFYTAARSLRQKLDHSTFNAAVFGLAAIFILPPAVAFTGTEWFAYEGEAWFYLLLIIAVPTCVGHALMNYAARYARVFTVNLAIVGEPALGIVLALLFLPDEKLFPVKLAGGASMMLAVLVGFRDERKRALTERGA